MKDHEIAHLISSLAKKLEETPKAQIRAVLSNTLVKILQSAEVDPTTLPPSRRFLCANCGHKCRTSKEARGTRTMCRVCERNQTKTK